MSSDIETWLAEVEKRAAAATEGPWRTWNHESYCPGYGCTEDGCPGHDTGQAHYVDGPRMDEDPSNLCGRTEEEEREILSQAHADCTFIAEARDDIPRLVAELRKTRAALANMVDAFAPVARFGSYGEACVGEAREALEGNHD